MMMKMHFGMAMIQIIIIIIIITKEIMDNNNSGFKETINNFHNRECKGTSNRW